MDRDNEDLAPRIHHCISPLGEQVETYPILAMYLYTLVRSEKNTFYQPLQLV
jgi:hypothetical protein